MDKQPQYRKVEQVGAYEILSGGSAYYFYVRRDGVLDTTNTGRLRRHDSLKRARDWCTYRIREEQRANAVSLLKLMLREKGDSEDVRYKYDRLRDLYTILYQAIEEMIPLQKKNGRDFLIEILELAEQIEEPE